MKHVGSYEAKTHLPKLLDAVERGETIVITRHGRPTARLVPHEQQPPRDTKNTVKEMLAFREKRKRTLGKLTWRDLINEGRRF